MAGSRTVQSRTGRKCVACTHSNRSEIESDLLSGESSIRGVARRWKLSPESLRRHYQAHVVAEIAGPEGMPAISVASRLLAVADAARDQRHESEDRGDVRAALLAGRAEREALTSLADRLGVKEADAMASLSDAQDLITAIWDTVHTDPRAALVLADQLAARGRNSWASAVRKRTTALHPNTSLPTQEAS